jgi:hypothetical protein
MRVFNGFKPEKLKQQGDEDVIVAENLLNSRGAELDSSRFEEARQRLIL